MRCVYGAGRRSEPVLLLDPDAGGVPCAVCAPGLIMRITAMVANNPNVTREEARVALSGNLCRCADYDKILNCAMRAAELARSV